MLTFLIIIFSLQIVVLFWYFLNHPNNDDSKNNLVKFCHISSVCMIGGLTFVIIFKLFYVYPGGRSGMIDLSELWRDFTWQLGRRRSNLNEFFFGYFMTLIILFLKDVGRKLK